MRQVAIKKMSYWTQLASRFLRRDEGSAILEFALTLPLLVVFVVGIYDFSGAFNQKQKLAQGTQEGAIVAGGQPTSDIVVGNANPDSLQPVVAAVFNSLAGSGVLPLAGTGSCKTTPPPVPVPGSGLSWTYTFTGCSGSFPGDVLTIAINRGSATTTAPIAVSTSVTVAYPYHWRFNSVIQLLFPGANYAAVTNLSESATVHNQT